MNTGTLYDALSCIDTGFIDAANDCAAVKAAFRKHKNDAVKRTVIPLTCVCAVALAAAVAFVQRAQKSVKRRRKHLAVLRIGGRNG